MFDKTDEIYDKVFKKQRISSNYKGIVLKLFILAKRRRVLYI